MSGMSTAAGIALNSGAFAWPGLPAGIDHSGMGSRELVVASSTQKPGTYTSLSVTYTDADGATAVDEFDLVVNGFKVVTDNGRTYTGFVVNSNGKCLDMRNAS
jgi:hypothetical protein